MSELHSCPFALRRQPFKTLQQLRGRQHGFASGSKGKQINCCDFFAKAYMQVGVSECCIFGAVTWGKEILM